ncbi:hypothetical protein Lal_00044871 [Lupinus albus]|nr:hypothetical protein Lal_00044871 [Lupinus albus]
MLGLGILSGLLIVPLCGAAFILTLNGDEASVARNSRWAALATTIVTFILSMVAWSRYDATSSSFQLVESHAWLAQGIRFKLGVDGFSMPLVLLTTFLMPFCIGASWHSISTRVKEYYVAFLVLETTMIGVFQALDLVLFYLFFEAGLIPMFLIIGIWGGKRRVYASFKFFLYTLLGSVLMLLAVMAMYWDAGTTDIPTLLQHRFPLRCMVAVASLLRLVRGEDADVAGPYLASRRARRGADRGLGDPGRHPPEDGWLRLHPDLAADVPGGEPGIRPPRLRPLGGRDHLHVADRDDADGHQEAHRLLVGGPYGLRDAGPVHPERAGHPGRPVPDDFPRHRVRRALPLRRRGLRPDAHPRDRGLWRPREAHAPLRGGDDGVHHGQCRPAGHLGLRGRGEPDGRLLLDLRHHPLGGLRPVALRKGDLREAGEAQSPGHPRSRPAREDHHRPPRRPDDLLRRASRARARRVRALHRGADDGHEGRARQHPDRGGCAAGRSDAARPRRPPVPRAAPARADPRHRRAAADPLRGLAGRTLRRDRERRRPGAAPRGPVRRAVAARHRAGHDPVGRLRVGRLLEGDEVAGAPRLVGGDPREDRPVRVPGADRALHHRHDGDGLGQRPDRPLSRAGAPVARRLRHRRLPSGRRALHGSGPEVLRARRTLLGHAALRFVADLRLHRHGLVPRHRLGPERSGRRRHRARHRVRGGGRVLQDVGGAVPYVDARRLRGLTDAGDGLLRRRAEDGGGVDDGAGVHRRPAGRDGGLAADLRVRLHRLDGAGLLRGHRPAVDQAPDGLFVHRQYRLRADRPRGGLAGGDRGPRPLHDHLPRDDAGTFAIILSLRRRDVMFESIEDLSGLSRTHPWLAFCLAAMMFSLAGVPPLAGFFAKFYVFAAAIKAGLVTLAVIGVVTSVVGAYYYLRIVKIMYFDEPKERYEAMAPGLRVVLALSSIVVILFVVMPDPLRAARAAGHRLHVHDRLGSTNTEALERARPASWAPLGRRAPAGSRAGAARQYLGLAAGQSHGQRALAGLRRGAGSPRGTRLRGGGGPRGCGGRRLRHPAGLGST